MSEPNERAVGNEATKTSQRIERLIQERHGMLPVWVRAPAKGPEFFSGFSRAKLYQLNEEGLIRSKSIKEPGKERGTRLFDLRSVLEFIERAPQEVS